LIIPIEVKSGKEGTLNITDAITQKGKHYQILNLPYYLGSQIEKYIDWFIQTKKVGQ
jgi:hypothetical protein